MTSAGSARRIAAMAPLGWIAAGLVAWGSTAPAKANSAPDWRAAASSDQPDVASRTGEVGQTGSATVTFGRALDLEGTPLRLTLPRRQSAATFPRSGSTMARGSFSPRYLPLRGAGITSGFGWRRHPISGGYKFHAGIDLAAPTGTPIVATAAGVVASADWYGGYGLCVTIDHQNGYVTLYGHMSAISVSAGQQVQPGQPLGRVGSTGSSTGPHLHYELRRDGYAVNPGL